MIRQIAIHGKGGIGKSTTTQNTVVDMAREVGSAEGKEVTPSSRPRRSSSASSSAASSLR